MYPRHLVSAFVVGASCCALRFVANGGGAVSDAAVIAAMQRDAKTGRNHQVALKPAMELRSFENSPFRFTGEFLLETLPVVE